MARSTRDQRFFSSWFSMLMAARTGQAKSPALRTEMLRGELNTSRRRRRNVESCRREISGRFVDLESHDICRVLIADMKEIAGWIEIEVPRRTALRVDPRHRGQLRIRRVDREDPDVVVSSIRGVQEL